MEEGLEGKTDPECGEHYPIGQEVRWKEGEKKASWRPEFSFLHFLIQYAVTSVPPPHIPYARVSWCTVM